MSGCACFGRTYLGHGFELGSRCWLREVTDESALQVSNVNEHVVQVWFASARCCSDCVGVLRRSVPTERKPPQRLVWSAV